jgi:CHAD domain-containing protein
VGIGVTDEREIKLDLDENFALPAFPGEPLPSRVFVSTYYDTDDRRLGRAGITLRRRDENGRSAWQLKLPRESSRLELEHEGGPARPPQPFRDALFGVTRGGTLESVTKLRTRRDGVLVAEEQLPVAEVVVDDVAVLDGNRVVAGFRELEVEARNGDRRALQRIERSLKRAGARAGNGVPKVLRALGDDFSTPEPGPGAEAAEHLVAMIKAQLAAILANDPAVRLGETAEDVHQLRVATRRLRAVLRTARPLLDETWSEPVRAELAWLGDALGAVRDLDVLIEYLEESAATLPEPDQRALAGVVRGLTGLRSDRRAKLQRELSTQRYLELLDALEAPRLRASKATVEELAAGEFERLRKAAKGTKTDEELHRLRVRGKRARYTAELAERSVGKPAARFIRAAKAFQDVVGEHQDAVVAEGRLRELAEQTGRGRAVFVLGRLVERQGARRSRARESLPSAWKRLEKAGLKAWR